MKTLVKVPEKVGVPIMPRAGAETWEEEKITGVRGFRAWEPIPERSSRKKRPSLSTIESCGCRISVKQK